MVASSSSTLVNVAEDAELRLVRLLAQSAPSSLQNPSFLQTCEACIVNEDAPGLMGTVVNDPGAVGALFVMEPPEEAVSAFSLLVALLDRVKADSPDQESQLAQALADAVVKADIEGKQIGGRQVAMLSALYNMRSDGREKTALLTRMIQLAGEKQPASLAAGKPLGNLLLEDTGSEGSPRLVSMLDTWEVPLADRRDLYRVAADGITESPSRKQRFTLLLVQSYTDASQVDEDGIAAAKAAAVGAIRDPVTLFAQQRSLLSLPAIQALEKKNATKSLHGLLKVFQEGKLEEYKVYLKENGGEDALLKPWNLSSDDCLRHMRILSLCSLAAEHEEVPYANVAETLQLPSDDEIESWVIAAVSSGLLSAKMDQLQKKVMVERAVVRRFDMEQWKVLQSRLQLWKKNVRGILEGLKQSQAGAAAVATSTSV